MQRHAALVARVLSLSFELRHGKFPVLEDKPRFGCCSNIKDVEGKVHKRSTKSCLSDLNGSSKMMCDGTIWEKSCHFSAGQISFRDWYLVPFCKGLFDQTFVSATLVQIA